MKHTLKTIVLSVGSAAFLFASGGAGIAGPLAVAGPKTVALKSAVTAATHYGYRGKRYCCKWCYKRPHGYKRHYRY